MSARGELGIHSRLDDIDLAVAATTKPTDQQRLAVWDPNLLTWVPFEQPAGSGSGSGTVDQGTGGGSAWLVTGPLTDTQLRASALPISVAALPLPSGAATLSEQQTQTSALGAVADAEATANGSILAILKRIRTLLGATLAVSVQNATLAVTGTFYQATQPVSAATLPLPSNAASETGGNLATLVARDFATQTTLALIKAKTDNLDVVLSTRTKPADQQHVIVDSSASIAVTGPLTDVQIRATPLPVSGTFYQATQPVSVAILPLATDAATATLQATQDTSINTLLKPASTLAAVTALGSITSALPAGTNNIGDVDVLTITDGPETRRLAELAALRQEMSQWNELLLADARGGRGLSELR